MIKYFINEDADNLETIECMAIINPKMCKNSSIQIEVEQANEGQIPHVHVYLDKTRNPKNCAYIRLDEPKYSEHHKDSKVLNRKQKDEFIQIMSNVWKKIYYIFKK